MAVLPFRGTTVGWRNGLRGTYSSSSTRNAKPSTSGGIIPGTSPSWELTTWKAAFQKGSGCPGAQVDHEPATCPCGEEDQQPPALHWEERSQQVEGGNSSPFYGTVEATRKLLCPALVSLLQERHKNSPAKASEMFKGLEHLSYEKMWICSA